MHRLRTVRLAALLVGLAMVAAACGGGDDEGGDDRGRQRRPVSQGGTLNYAADQEPTGFNNNTSKDNGTSVANIVINMYPVAFHLTPDFKVVMNEDLLESAEQTSEDPQTIVYKIKENAVWSDDTPITADDFIYLYENLNGTKKDNDAPAPPATTRWRASRGPTTARRSRSSSRPPSVTGSRCSPPGPTSCRPTTSRSSRRLEHRAGQEPREHPLRWLVQGRELHRGPEPDVVRNDKYFGPSPTSTRWLRFLRERPPSGGAGDNQVDLDYPATPARRGDHRSRPCPT